MPWRLPPSADRLCWRFCSPPDAVGNEVRPFTLSTMLFGDEHVRRYVETDGEVGHDWGGTQTLILTTTGRRSGEPRSTPLIYGRAGENYLVVASKGGSDAPPAWYRNLVDDP